MVLKSLKDLHKKGGFAATVMGREVTVKVWIHFFIGDTEGNNKWLGHYPGNRKGYAVHTETVSVNTINYATLIRSVCIRLLTI